MLASSGCRAHGADVPIGHGMRAHEQVHDARRHWIEPGSHLGFWLAPTAGAARATTGQPEPYGSVGSVGVDINCAVIGYTNKPPTDNLAPPAPNAQFPPR